MANQKAIGIDLGTTNSAAAWVDETGRTAMVTNAEGDLLTPSVVLFDEAEVVVGKEARTATTVIPDRVAEWVKRDMGAPVYNRPIRGEYLPPEVIQACILRKLKTDVTRNLGPETRVVITVPAYFDEPRRKATADAGEMAGLTVLDIVNEPTAAALAFGEVVGYLSPTDPTQQEMNVLVYDLGGGTFDATLLRLAPGDIRMLATDGDVQLGGHDWDMRLVDYMAEAFKTAHGADPREDPAALGRLYNAVIDAKHTLSARNRTSVRIDHAGQSAEIPVTRQQFEEMTADLLERTAYTSRQLLIAAKMEWQDVSRILLVGGSTRMAMVSQMLQQLSGIAPDHTVNPDEAVARGAALYAHYLLAKQDQTSPEPAYEVTNVNAHSLGVEGIEQETFRKSNFVLIPRNTPLPARFTEKFITKSEGQRSIVIQILQGESSLPGECTAIGRTVIRDLPTGLPKGWPVEVTFEYGTNGRLNVRAVVSGTHREVTLELERNVGLSNEGISRWMEVVSAAGGFDTFESSLQGAGNATGGEMQPAPSQPAVASQSAAPSQPVPAGSARWNSGSPAPAPASGPPPLSTSAGTPPPVPATGAQQTWPQPVSDTDPAPQPAADAPAQPSAKRPIPRWAVYVGGHVAAILLGLGLGYMVLHFLRPDSFPVPW